MKVTAHVGTDGFVRLRCPSPRCGKNLQLQAVQGYTGGWFTCPHPGCGYRFELFITPLTPAPIRPTSTASSPPSRPMPFPPPPGSAIPPRTTLPPRIPQASPSRPPPRPGPSIPGATPPIAPSGPLIHVQSSSLVSRGAKQTKRRTAFWSAIAVAVVGIIAVVCLLTIKPSDDPTGLAGVLQATTQRLGGSAPSLVLESLQDSLKLSGTVIFQTKTKTQYPSTVTYQEAKLQLDLTNGSSNGLRFGQTMMLIESNAQGSLYNGVLAAVRIVQQKDKADDWHAKGDYGLSTHETRYVGGESFTGGSLNAMLFLNGRDLDADKKSDTTPESVDAQKQTSLKMTFNRGSWLNPESRQAVRFVWPEIEIASGAESIRCRLIVSFQKATTAEGIETWKATQSTLVHLDAKELARRTNDPGFDAVSRVLTANWWIEAAPSEARAGLSKIGASLHEGALLYSCLELLSQEKDGGLARHAEVLLVAPDTPPGIVQACVRYLVVLGKDPDMTAMIKIASGDNDESARLTIFTLGRLKTPNSTKALQALLADPKLSARHSQIRSNLGLKD